MVVRTEDALPTAWVYVDVAGRDIGSYVAEAQREVAQGDAAARLHARVERTVRVHAAGGGEAHAGRSGHARDHLPAAVPQFQQRGRDA